MLGWADARHLPERWDFIVVNVGHHAAAGAEHWTLSEYKAHVEAFLSAMEHRLQEQTDKHIRGRNADATKLVWIASHAMPTARDNQISGSGVLLLMKEERPAHAGLPRAPDQIVSAMHLMPLPFIPHVHHLCPFPVRTRALHVPSGDWRTNQRLALYEGFARQRFEEMQDKLGAARVMYQVESKLA